MRGRHFIVYLILVMVATVLAAPLDDSGSSYIVYVEWSGSAPEHLEQYTTAAIEDALDLIASDFKENLAISMHYGRDDVTPYVQIQDTHTKQTRRRGFAQASVIDIFDQMSMKKGHGDSSSSSQRKPLAAATPPPSSPKKRNLLKEMRDHIDSTTVQFVQQRIFSMAASAEETAAVASSSSSNKRSLLTYRGHQGTANKTKTKSRSEDPPPPQLKILIDRNVPFGIRSVPVWNLDRINQATLPLDQAWSLPSAYASIPTLTGLDLAWIYIVDVGILASHVELAGRVTVIHNGFPAQPLGCNIHATHVAGTAAGVNVGVNPKARVFDVRVLDCNGSGTLATVLSGIMSINNHCTSNGGSGHRSIVINMSIGGPGSVNSGDGLALGNELGLSRTLCDAVIVAAAGNEHESTCNSLPAAFVTPQQGRVIAAGATAINDGFAGFSNYGPCTAINAPGVNILSASNSGTSLYDTLSGTSMASPLVAGVASVHSMRRPVNWAILHPGFLFADSIYQKITVTDAVSAIVSAPAGTTRSLLQITATPIPISSPVLPSPSPPPPHLSNAISIMTNTITITAAVAVLVSLLLFA